MTGAGMGTLAFCFMMFASVLVGICLVSRDSRDASLRFWHKEAENYYRTCFAQEAEIYKLERDIVKLKSGQDIRSKLRKLKLDKSHKRNYH